MDDKGPGQQVLVAAPFLDATARRITPLDSAWEFCELPPGRGPADSQGLSWRPARVPGTVAGALRALGRLEDEAGIDEREFLFRRRFPRGEGGAAALVLEGLATLAEVWLNGACLLTTQNMFRRYAIETGEALAADNELVLRFRPLATELARTRARPRWPTRLVKHRNMRYLRTSLLGRIPGWSSFAPPAGPWRGVRLVEGRRLALKHLELKASLAGADGVLTVTLRGERLGAETPTDLHIRVDDQAFSTGVRTSGNEFEAQAELRIPGVDPWWCHDLGTAHRYRIALALKCGRETLDLGSTKVGFRRVEALAAQDGGFGLRLNGQELFCRGACWTPCDPVGFADDTAEIRRVLGLARDAGFNMIRLNGTMTYEVDAFYDACDELGILVWQDFMFSRMDYPESDAEFAREAAREAEQLLSRIHHRPCVAVLCGNNEVEQQAAMMGLDPHAGETPLFSQSLAQAVARWCPGVPYLRSSPTGGALPFHVDCGVAHYFGVGAYLRPLADARTSGVRFASECLAFSNVPEDEGLDDLFGDEARVAHSPRYQRGVPRDPGAGWDFADVTDHYLEGLFGCNARELRYADTERYFALARIAPGEMMARAIGVWRAAGSPCRGALVWFLRDLAPGSGWGILDSAGRPKAPYWFLKRACAARALWFTDEGLNGLRLQLRNDGPGVLDAEARVRLLRADGLEVAAGRTPVTVGAHSGHAFSVDALIGRFTDATWAYRFGPCPYAVAVAELLGAGGTVLARAHYLPAGFSHELRDTIGLRALARSEENGYRLRIEARELALFVRVAAAGFLPSDNYFHLAPGVVHEVKLTGAGTQRPRIRIEALNARSEADLELLG